jgi:hypothetical protein
LEKPDWGEIYTMLLVHTSMQYEAIQKRTLPQINEIRANLPKHICMKAGIPYKDPNEEVLSKPGKPNTITEFMSFVADFD